MFIANVDARIANWRQLAMQELCNCYEPWRCSLTRLYGTSMLCGAPVGARMSAVEISCGEE